MGLDSIILKKVCYELKENIISSHVDKITMPARDIVILTLRNKNGVKKLLISARSAMSRIHITENEYDNPANPPSFCMLLRKYIGNGRIKDIRHVDNERIVLIYFDVINEKGDLVEILLSIEMMGRYSNIVLVNNENRIVDALKHIDSDMSDRRHIFPGLEFTLPPLQNKLPFLSTDTNTLVANIVNQGKPLSSAVLFVIAGISPVVAREIATCTSPVDEQADILCIEEKQKLNDTIERFKNIAEDSNSPFFLTYENRVPLEYSFVPLTQYYPLISTPFSSISTLLDSYYKERENAELLKSRSSGLKKQVQTILERTIRRQHSREEELNSTEKADKAKLFGELLTVNLNQVTKGMTSVKLYNYYDDTNIDIPLDPRNTPNQNAQRYYREYRKLTTARDILKRLLEEGASEIEYLESVSYEAELASTEEEFLAIREELHQAGFLKSFKPPKKKSKRKVADFLEYLTSDGFKILVGKNNAANDKLSLHTASKSDMWFHVKYGAGSHTVLLLDNNEASDTALSEAAQVAAFHSNHNLDGQTAVDFTEIRNVKKAPGQKTGMVIYKEFKTIFVTPDKEKVLSLRVKK